MQPRAHALAIGPELLQPCPVAGAHAGEGEAFPIASQHRRIAAGIGGEGICSDRQASRRHLAAELCRMLQIRFRPAVAITEGIRTTGNGRRTPAHGMGEGAGAEVGVVAEIGGDHIHAEL